MPAFTKVRGVLCIAHGDHRRNPDGPLHGHTYEVWAKFLYVPGLARGDALFLQSELAQVLEKWDHDTVLDIDAEQLAETIFDELRARELFCDAVELRRGPEGIIASWEAP